MFTNLTTQQLKTLNPLQLLEKENGKNLLHYFSEKQENEAVEYLINKINANEIDKEGNTPLMLAVKTFPFNKDITEEKLEEYNKKALKSFLTVQLLVEKTNVNIKNKKGDDALSISRSYFHLPLTIKLLILHTNLKNTKMNTLRNKNVKCPLCNKPSPISNHYVIQDIIRDNCLICCIKSANYYLKNCGHICICISCANSMLDYKYT
jgi:hypothetical protein